MNVETLKKHVKDLNNAVSSKNIQEAINILRILKDVQATEDLLRQTKAGVAVSKLRSNDDTKISGLSKEVVAKWKAQVDAGKKKAVLSANGSASSTAPGTPSAPSAALNSAAPSPVKKPTISTSGISASSSNVPPSRSPSVATPSSSVAPERRSSVAGLGGPTPSTSSGSDARSSLKDGIQLGSLKEKTRDKCLELTYDAMVFDSGAPAEQVFKRATQIERLVYEEVGDHGNQYRTKIRRLILNLKDKSNPSLRAAVVSGDLAVERFCKMTNQEMASEERKQANELLNANNLHNSLGAAEQEAETDAFKCGRCKQRKTRYRQAQTRSADEPMTTFVTCVNCGNRWKFS